MQEFNLINHSLSELNKIKKNTLVLTYKAGGLLVFLALFFYWNKIVDDKIIFIESHLKVLSEKKKYLKERKSEYKGLLDRKKKLKEKKEIYNYLTDNQDEVLEFQKIINGSVPKGVWFTSEKYNNDSDFIITGVSISDRGIIDFIGNLRQSKRFELVNIEEINVIEKKSKINFKLREFKIKVKV